MDLVDWISDIDPALLVCGAVIAVCLLWDVLLFMIVWGVIFTAAGWAYYVVDRGYTSAHAQTATIEHVWPYAVLAAFVLGCIGKIFRL